MSKAKFEAARELIQEKRYDEARAILKTLDHPLAKEWLVKLEKTAPEVKRKSETAPSDTSRQNKRLPQAPKAVDFITLTCPSCGGKLQVTPDLDRFACMFCGAEHIVRRSGGAISLSPVVEAITKIQEGVQGVRGSVEKVQTGVDKTTSELALRRLKEEINNLRQAQEKIEYPTNTASLLFYVTNGASEVRAKNPPAHADVHL